MAPVGVVFSLLVALPFTFFKYVDRPLHLIPRVVDQTNRIVIQLYTNLLDAIESTEQFLEVGVGLFVQVGIRGDLVDLLLKARQQIGSQRQA